MSAAKSSLFQKIDECMTQNHYFSIKIHRFPIFGPTCSHIALGRFLGSQIEAIWHHHGLRSQLNLLSDRARPLPNVLKIACDALNRFIWLLYYTQKRAWSILGSTDLHTYTHAHIHTYTYTSADPPSRWKGRLMMGSI